MVPSGDKIMTIGFMFFFHYESSCLIACRDANPKMTYHSCIKSCRIIRRGTQMLPEKVFDETVVSTTTERGGFGSRKTTWEL